MGLPPAFLKNGTSAICSNNAARASATLSGLCRTSLWNGSRKTSCMGALHLHEPTRAILHDGMIEGTRKQRLGLPERASIQVRKDVEGAILGALVDPLGHGLGGEFPA